MTVSRVSVPQSWSAAEEARLRAVFTACAGDDAVLAAHLPARTASAVKAKRHRLGLFRAHGRGRVQRCEPAPRRDVIYIASPKGRPGGDIICAAAARHGLRVEDVLGKRRFKELVAARRDAIVSLCAEPKPQGGFRTLPEVARLMRLDHTSVSHHLKCSGYASVHDLRTAVSSPWAGLWPEGVAA